MSEMIDFDGVKIDAHLVDDHLRFLMKKYHSEEYELMRMGRYSSPQLNSIMSEIKEYIHAMLKAKEEGK